MPCVWTSILPPSGPELLAKQGSSNMNGAENLEAKTRSALRIFTACPTSSHNNSNYAARQEVCCLPARNAFDPIGFRAAAVTFEAPMVMHHKRVASFAPKITPPPVAFPPP